MVLNGRIGGRKTTKIIGCLSPISKDNVVIQIGLAHNQDAITRPARGLGCNGYFWTDNVKALVNGLANESIGRDVMPTEGPVDRKYACREWLLNDCNGLTLCFAQRI
ncbi:MAG: hypothetical protein DWI28_01710 [Planctomycetota bacterium]|nr:MAG: hypothetical protein DWI28_01710 [Planctomycetota bacterium]